MSSGALRPAGALANTDKVYGETACGAVGVCANTGATIPHINSAGASPEAYAFIVHFLLRLTWAFRGLPQTWKIRKPTEFITPRMSLSDEWAIKERAKPSITNILRALRVIISSTSSLANHRPGRCRAPRWAMMAVTTRRGPIGNAADARDYATPRKEGRC